jgi:hypothetical protein
MGERCNAEMVIGLSLATVMGYGGKDAAQTKEKNAFGEELQSAISVSGRQEIAVATENGQVPAAAMAGPGPGPGDGSMNWLAPIAVTNTGSVHELENPIPKVQDLLIKMGINPAEIQFELLDDINSNPIGTGHVNHFLRVRTPNGWKEDYAVEYINRNANITANEIAMLRRLPVAPDHLRGV